MKTTTAYVRWIRPDGSSYVQRWENVIASPERFVETLRACGDQEGFTAVVATEEEYRMDPGNFPEGIRSTRAPDPNGLGDPPDTTYEVEVLNPQAATSDDAVVLYKEVIVGKIVCGMVEVIEDELLIWFPISRIHAISRWIK